MEPWFDKSWRQGEIELTQVDVSDLDDNMLFRSPASA